MTACSPAVRLDKPVARWNSANGAWSEVGEKGAGRCDEAFAQGGVGDQAGRGIGGTAGNGNVGAGSVDNAGSGVAEDRAQRRRAQWRR